MNSKKQRYILNRMIYLMARFYHFFSKCIPMNHWLAIGRFMGLCIYLIDYPHKKISLANLRFAFGQEKSERQIRALARRNFQQFGMIAHEWLTLKDMTKERIDSLVRVEGEEHLRAAKNKSPSVILLSAHFGNWEYSHLRYGSSMNPLHFIVREVENPFLEEERVAYNRRYGVNVLYKENGLRPAIRGFKKKIDLVIFADQKANLNEGISSTFFGKKTSTLHVVPSLAMKYKIPVVPMFIARCKDHIHHRVVFLPEIPIDYNGGRKAIQDAVQRQNDAIEKIIRSYPDHWLWFHRKWKTYHPGIYK
jgi:KDO2-lipid IV(A) lauroyltransferase